MSELLEALKEVRDRVTWATELSLKTICDEGKKKRKQFVLKLKKKKNNMEQEHMENPSTFLLILP